MSSETLQSNSNNEYCIIEKYSLFEKIVYWSMSAFGWCYGYLTLVPYFLRHGTFRNVHLDDIPSVCVDDKGELEKSYRNRKSLDGLSVGFSGVSTLGDLMKYSTKMYGKRPFIGTRKLIEKKSVTDENTGRIFKKYCLGEYEWKSFNEISLLANHFKNGLLQIDTIWNNKENQIPKIAIFAKNSEQWVVSHIGVFATSSILVTVFSNMDDSSIIYALNQTQPALLIIDQGAYKRITSLIDNLDQIKNLIVIGNNVNKSIPALIERKINIWTYNEIIEIGKNDSTNVVSITQPNPDDLAVIMYTSGSGGRPKGVCLSHLNILSSLGSLPVEQLKICLKVTPFYLPCAHTLGLGYVILSMMFGSQIGHCRTLTLFDNSPGLMAGTKGDFSELKPCCSFIVPLIVDRLVKAVVAKIKTKSRFVQLVFDFAINYKIYFLKMGHLNAPIIDNVLLKKIPEVLGGCLKLVYSAGGPISNETSFMFSALFNVNLKQVYGTTESFGVEGPYSLDCGAVGPAIELKLIPWEEGNYGPGDFPNPRGEVCLHGAPIAKEYYQLEEETRRKFVTDEKTNKRWYLTGDIGEYLPNGNFRIIDRKENIIKLSDGEFLSLSKVESHIGNSDYVEMCCCVPSSNHHALIAIISPKRVQIAKLLDSQDNLHNVEDMNLHINDPQIQKVIIDDIKSKLKSLSKWEKPSKFIITPDIWSPENKLLTSIFKIRRHNIKKHYQHLC